MKIINKPFLNRREIEKDMQIYGRDVSKDTATYGNCILRLIVKHIYNNPCTWRYLLSFPNIISKVWLHILTKYGLIKIELFTLNISIFLFCLEASTLPMIAKMILTVKHGGRNIMFWGDSLEFYECTILHWMTIKQCYLSWNIAEEYAFIHEDIQTTKRRDYSARYRS